MKDKMINFKNNIVSTFSNIKNRTVPIIIENKKVFIVALIILIVILLAISMPSKNKIGNTNGNLDNSGFTAKNGKNLYFFGYKDGITNGIYKSKGNKEEKVNGDYGLYLNELGKYIYYLDTQEDNIVRIKNNGKDKEIIVKGVDNSPITVVDNWIYYFDNSCLYRVKTNGENKKIISKKSIESYQVVGNWIYYSYVNEGNYVLAKMKINGDESIKIDSKVGKSFFVDGKDIYFIYGNPETANYELYKMKINGKNKKKIADLSKNVDMGITNFTKNALYYTKFNEELKLGIYRIDLKGKKEIKITDIKGYTTRINVHDNWIYYPDENEEGNVQIFKVETNGKNNQGL